MTVVLIGMMGMVLLACGLSLPAVVGGILGDAAWSPKSEDFGWRLFGFSIKGMVGLAGLSFVWLFCGLVVLGIGKLVF